jgi:hypothetical protein
MKSPAQKTPEAMATRMNSLVELLESNEMNVADICRTLKVSDSTARTYISILRGDEEIYISKWAVNGKTLSPLFRADNQPDVPRPDGRKPMGCIPYRVSRPNSASVPRDPLDVAFFGEYKRRPVLQTEEVNHGLE